MNNIDSLYQRARDILLRCAANIGKTVTVSDDDFFILIGLVEDGLLNGTLINNGATVKCVTIAGLRFIDEASAHTRRARIKAKCCSFALFLLGILSAALAQTVANWISPAASAAPCCNCQSAGDQAKGE